MATVNEAADAERLRLVREQILNRRPVTEDPALSDEAFLEASRKDRAANTQEQVLSLIQSAASRKNIAPQPVQSQQEILLKRRAMRKDDLPDLAAKEGVLSKMMEGHLAKDPNAIAVGRAIMKDIIPRLAETPELGRLDDTRHFDALKELTGSAARKSEINFQAEQKLDAESRARVHAEMKERRERAFEAEMKTAMAEERRQLEADRRAHDISMQNLRNQGALDRAKLKGGAKGADTPALQVRKDALALAYGNKIPEGIYGALNNLKQFDALIKEAGGLENVTGFGYGGQRLPGSWVGLWEGLVNEPARGQMARQILELVQGDFRQARSGLAVSKQEAEFIQKALSGSGTEEEVRNGLLLLRERFLDAFAEVTESAPDYVVPSLMGKIPVHAQPDVRKRSPKAARTAGPAGADNAVQVDPNKMVKLRDPRTGGTIMKTAEQAAILTNQKGPDGKALFVVEE